MRKYLLVLKTETTNYKQLILHSFILIIIMFFILYHFGLVYGKQYDYHQSSISVFRGSTENATLYDLEQLTSLAGISSYIILSDTGEFMGIEIHSNVFDYYVAALSKNYSFDATLQGRPFTHEEQSHGANVVIIPYSYSLLFDMNIGDTMEINNTSYEITGIAPYMNYESFIIPEKNLFEHLGINNDIEVYSAEGFSLATKSRTKLISAIEDILKSPVFDVDETPAETYIASYTRGLKTYSLVLFLMGAINILYIYSYILEKRKKRLNIYRLNGATKDYIIRFLFIDLIIVYAICFGLAYGLIILVHGLLTSTILKGQTFKLTAKDITIFFLGMLFIYLALMFIHIRKLSKGSIIRSLKGGT